MTNLGGHCMATLVEAFDAAQDDVPTLFVAWTVKGFGLPFAGHKDNHSGLMNPTQAHAMRDAMGIAEGDEWEPFAGIGANALPAVKALVEQSRIRRDKRERSFGQVEIPAIPAPAGGEQSTQAAFGNIMLDLSRDKSDLADRIVTTSPDVTVSTNLGPWVNQRGLFKRREMKDVFAAAKIASAQKWARHKYRPAHRIGDRRVQSFPGARRARPVGRPVRPAAVSRRHALRPVHRPRPR